MAHKTCTNKTFMCVKLPNWSQGRNSQGAEYWAKERNETAELLPWETYVLHLHIYQHSKDFLICSCSLENFVRGCLELHQSCRTHFGFSGKLYRVARKFINEDLSLREKRFWRSSDSLVGEWVLWKLFACVCPGLQSSLSEVLLLSFVLKKPKKLSWSNNNVVAPS